MEADGGGGNTLGTGKVDVVLVVVMQPPTKVNYNFQDQLICSTNDLHFSSAVESQASLKSTL